MSDSPEVHTSQGERGSSHPFIDNLAELTLWDDEGALVTEYHYSQASLPRHTLRIKDLPSEERPRDRLVTSGVKSLSTGELLSILLGTGQGSGKLSAVGLGQHILQVLSDDQRDPMEGLRDITVQELMQISGIGLAKAATILAAVELGKRVFLSRPPVRTLIDDPATAAAVLTADLMWQTQEQVAVLLLDVTNRLMGSRVIAIGTATETVVHPREIFREAIRQGATRIIVGHNHPSGNVEPSTEDILLTRQLLQAGQLLSIPVLDHLILGNGNHLSLRQVTSLWDELQQE
ncbi:DNA repair protein RadC [Oculatella sp. FACHB-28]|uniref:RadC family protein n=1 Tax=Oculatella sp. FACHB-28 TaxID=2692845 RepID=UPI0016848CE4|nr:DNA repair protein RadC [Oculatella sp. FACHB-28]MBD2058746.1 DNA repair protein RadC [Oculatella sp. FACHB-28]